MTFRRRLSFACSGLVVFAAAMLTHAEDVS